jgi:transposase
VRVGSVVEAVCIVSLGIDVSTAKLHVCLRREADGKQKTKVVENSPTGVNALVDWLARQGTAPAEVHAVLEATGVYHEGAAEALHAKGLRVSIVNPAQAKNFARGLAVRTKTDAVDAETLARSCSHRRGHHQRPRCARCTPCWPANRP